MSSESLSSAGEEQSVSLLGNAMEARAEHLKTRNYRSLYAFTTALGVGLFIMVLTWLIKYRGGFAWNVNDPGHQFNWHPLLMITGLLLIYGQSILIYRTGRTALKKPLKIAHGVLHATSFVLSVIGLKAAFDSHNNIKPNPTPNLYTMHSWLGLITVIIFSGQLVVGFASFLYPGLAKTLRQALLPVHTAIGVATFIMAITTIVTGFTEKTIWAVNNYREYPSEGILCNFMCLFCVFFGVMVVYLVNEPDYKRNNLPEDNVALSATE